MTAPLASDRPPIGILGGTGPHGMGLAGRLAAAGYTVILGSRRHDNAAETAAKLRAQLPAATLSPAVNLEAATRAEILIATVPYAAQEELLPPLRDAIGQKILVSCANPIRFDGSGPVPVQVPGGSAAQECQQLLPDARVISGFQNVSAVKLRAFAVPLQGHVLLAGDNEAAKTATAALVLALPDLTPIDAGPLRLSGPIEAMTAVLVSINRRYKINAGLGLTGVPPRPPTGRAPTDAAETTGP